MLSGGEACSYALKEETSRARERRGGRETTWGSLTGGSLMSLACGATMSDGLRLCHIKSLTRMELEVLHNFSYRSTAIHSQKKSKKNNPKARSPKKTPHNRDLFTNRECMSHVAYFFLFFGAVDV